MKYITSSANINLRKFEHIVLNDILVKLNITSTISTLHKSVTKLKIFTEDAHIFVVIIPLYYYFYSKCDFLVKYIIECWILLTDILESING